MVFSSLSRGPEQGSDQNQGPVFSLAIDSASLQVWEIERCE